MLADPLGETVRNFYSCYGVPDEGPPENVDLSLLAEHMQDMDEELGILRNAVGDPVLHRKFRQCRDILDDIATRLTGTDLLEELSAIKVSRRDFKRLTTGVLWWGMAASLDERNPDAMPDCLSTLPLPLRTLTVVHGSLVLRLYLSLVYMREGLFREILSQAARRSSPTAGRVLKLLNCDYVRHIRNSLAHGSFSPTIAGIYFRDEQHVVVATPGFLNWLAGWVLLAQDQAAASQERGAYPDGA